MGIRDKPIAPGSPWQNGFAERLIGSIRRECVDHVIALGEAHLRRILQAYARYFGRPDSANLYIRSALLSEVVSANIQSIVQQTCLMNPEHRIQLGDA
jgi:transposase InsO family protein